MDETRQCLNVAVRIPMLKVRLFQFLSQTLWARHSDVAGGLPYNTYKLSGRV
jgi:hypothetical protein